VTRTSEQIKSEIEQRFGFFPPFFGPALGSHQVLENLWQQTLSAYIEAPFSALFKEKLSALLSRFCAAPYCMIVHSAALRPLGMTATQVLTLLDTPLAGTQETDLPLGVLPVPSPEEVASPTPGSPLEAALLLCATAVFLDRGDAEAGNAELCRLLGAELHPHLVAYLAYIKTCHTWIEAYPAISYEADQRAKEHLGPLLTEEPALAEFFRHYRERVAGVYASRATQAAVTAERARSGQAIRDSEENLRLLVDGAKDYAMILMDAEGRVTSWNTGAERILGWAEAEVLGQPADFIFTPEDRAAGVPAQEIKNAAFDGKSLDLRWQIKQDGTRFFADGLLERLRDGNGKIRGFAKILRDATAGRVAEDERRRADEERRQTQVALAASHQRTINVLESITDAFFAVDAEWRFTYLNAQGEKLLSRPRHELLGKCVWDEFPAAVGTAFDREYRRAVAEQTTATFEEYYPPPLDTWFEIRAYPSPDGLSVYFHDITDRKRTQNALRASEEALRESEAQLRDAQSRLEAALAAGGIATWTWDLATDRVVADANLARLFSVSAEDAAGGDLDVYLQAIHPDDRPSIAQAIADAVAHREVYQAEYRVVLPDGSHRWLATRGRVERDAEGQAVALPGVVVDITERAERGRRERFLADLAERARRLTDPDAVIADALRSVGQFLGVSRCVFVDIDIEDDSCTCHPDYRADETVASMAGVFPISAFGAIVVAEYGAGRAVIVDDVWASPAQVPKESIATYDAVGIRAHVGVPVVHSARLVSCIGVHSSVPRRWKPEEVELLQAVVERTWLTVEILRQQRALMRGAEEQRARAEREALLNRIGQALRASTAPEKVLETAVRELGEALGADRCYYAAYDQDADTATVGPEWHGDGLPTLAGQYTMSSFAVNRDPVYRAGRTQTLADTSIDPAILKLGLRALVRVPLVSGASMTTLSVAMTEGPRAWSADEVSLVEAVATQTQTALEAVRVQRREHRIAEQLQDALQPPLPAHIPGLAVSKYYEAALTDEAGVGGDFYDVFAVGQDCTALIVGDLSGKGLAAAAQVSIVRNMLRAFLYSKPTVAEAVTDLNYILAENSLLSGFSTLFVGAYDAGTRVLSYVNCGQEPALVRRGATGVIEQLGSTGPILGAFNEGQFSEETVTLAPGDALAIFTDGLTEIGPSRRDMLGIEGVAALLGEPLTPAEAQGAAEQAELLALRLITGVDKAAKGGVMRDDVCLLVTVVEFPVVGS